MITPYAAKVFGRMARQKPLEYMTALDGFLDTLDKASPEPLDLYALLSISAAFHQGYETGLKHG